MRRWAAVLGLSASLVGCWTLTSNLGDIEGDDAERPGSSNGSSGNRKDGGDELLDAVGTSSSSSGNTSSSSSGSLIVDAGDGAPGSFCEAAGAHTICDEFSVGTAADRWGIQQGNGGVVTQVQTTVKSAPNAMRFTTAAPCTESFASLGRSFNEAQMKSAVVSFDVFLVSAPSTSGDMYLMGWEWTTGGGGAKKFRFDVAFRQGKIDALENAINDEGFRIAGTSAATFTKGTWHRVEAQFDVEAAKVLVFVDGEKWIDVGLQRIRPQVDNASRLDVGLYTGGNCDVPGEAFYDNVIVDFVKK